MLVDVGENEVGSGGLVGTFEGPRTRGGMACGSRAGSRPGRGAKVGWRASCSGPREYLAASTAVMKTARANIAENFGQRCIIFPFTARLSVLGRYGR